MKLILEETFDVDNVVELNESTNEKTYVIKGTFSTPDVKNRNGRVYAKQLWEDNVSNYQKEIAIKSVNTLMEKEHPPRTAVNPWEAVAQIRLLEMRNGLVYGEAELLNIKETETIRALIDKGVKIGVSSRGVGKMKGHIVEEFSLVTYDIVSTPSDYNANLQGFNESMLLENIDISKDDNGKWACTPSGCTLTESKDITKDVMKKLKKGEEVMLINPNEVLVSFTDFDDDTFVGIDQFDNDVEETSLKGYRLDEGVVDSVDILARELAKDKKFLSGAMYRKFHKIMMKNDTKLATQALADIEKLRKTRATFNESEDKGLCPVCESPKVKYVTESGKLQAICENSACKATTLIRENVEKSDCGCKAKALIEVFDKVANKKDDEAKQKADTELQAKFDSYMSVTEATGTNDLFMRIKNAYYSFSDSDAKGLVVYLNNLDREEAKKIKIDIDKESNIWAKVAELISSSRLGRVL